MKVGRGSVPALQLRMIARNGISRGFLGIPKWSLGTREEGTAVIDRRYRPKGAPATF